ncbi:MAG: RHS repeat-associated core domain-containing protein, partial [Crocinitomicaceae bacterium]
YYPFGMIMDGRNGNSGDYRYGFNGAEGDNEAFDNNGSFYDLGLRCYNPLTARMFQTDPRKSEYPWQTPYAYHRNSPIGIIDFLGGGDPEKESGLDTDQDAKDKGYNELEGKDIKDLFGGKPAKMFRNLHKILKASDGKMQAVRGETLVAEIDKLIANTTKPKELKKLKQTREALTKLDYATITKRKITVHLVEGESTISFPGSPFDIDVEDNSTVDASGLTIMTKNLDGYSGSYLYIKGSITLSGVESFLGINVEKVKYETKIEKYDNPDSKYHGNLVFRTSADITLGIGGKDDNTVLIQILNKD